MMRHRVYEIHLNYSSSNNFWYSCYIEKGLAFHRDEYTKEIIIKYNKKPSLRKIVKMSKRKLKQQNGKEE